METRTRDTFAQHPILATQPPQLLPLLARKALAPARIDPSLLTQTLSDSATTPRSRAISAIAGHSGGTTQRNGELHGAVSRCVRVSTVAIVSYELHILSRGRRARNGLRGQDRSRPFHRDVVSDALREEDSVFLGSHGRESCYVKRREVGSISFTHRR